MAGMGGGGVDGEGVDEGGGWRGGGCKGGSHSKHETGTRKTLLHPL